MGVVWCDIPVLNLLRAKRFYETVLACKVHLTGMQSSVGVLEYKEGETGACLFEVALENHSRGGSLLYFSVEGRLEDAVEKAKSEGAVVNEPIHAIPPHGRRSIITDTEGNRIALHSHT